MDTSIIFISIAGLLLISVSANALYQYLQKAEATIKQEITMNVAIIKATQELLHFTCYLPYQSNVLLKCLNTRLIHAAKGILKIDPDNSKASDIVHQAQVDIQSLKSATNEQKVNRLQFGENDNKAMVFLKLIKRLQTTLKSEHDKGNIVTDLYVEENEKLDSLRTQINIDNAKNRARLAIQQGNHGAAMQILNKGVDYAKSRTDQYAVSVVPELNKMLEAVSTAQKNKQKQSTENKEQGHEDKRKMEINQLFEKNKSYW